MTNPIPITETSIDFPVAKIEFTSEMLRKVTDFGGAFILYPVFVGFEIVSFTIVPKEASQCR